MTISVYMCPHSEIENKLWFELRFFTRFGNLTSQIFKFKPLTTRKPRFSTEIWSNTSILSSLDDNFVYTCPHSEIENKLRFEFVVGWFCKRDCILSRETIFGQLISSLISLPEILLLHSDFKWCDSQPWNFRSWLFLRCKEILRFQISYSLVADAETTKKN